MHTNIRRLTTAALAAAGAAIALAPSGVHAAPAGEASTTGASGTVRVDGLNVRSAPTTSSPKVVSVEKGDTFEVRCQAPGTAINGTTWFAIGPDVGKWVAGYYLDVDGPVPACAEGTSKSATTLGDPVLNSFQGPSLNDDGEGEYELGSSVKVTCSVTNESSESEKWYLTTDREWLPADYVKVRRGADLGIC